MSDANAERLARAWVVDPRLGLRRPTRVVRVGDVEVGGDNPIRIQSMTNTDTMDTDATVDQVEQMADAGCEIARVTAPSIRDAENLAEIVRRLRARGVGVPLVADIHFTPNAALIAAEHVEKVRINPGNYADKKKFEVREYSDAQYAEELERVADRFRPLVRRCAELGVAMRIGTNHGSLSDRIMNRYGDTPAGMVESALEFLDVCEAESYRDVVFSMKASNAQVAIQAYRLLAARLAERDPGAPSYPFHVGVTEAGDGEDGRVKSAIGIGSLLEDGIGDTIRVSLTEDPVKELPVARALARRSEARWAADRDAAPEVDGLEESVRFVPDPFDHARRATAERSLAGLEIGGDAPVRVELDLGPVGAEGAEDLEARAARVATGLSLLRDVECEGIGLAADDDGGIARAGALVDALATLGVSLPTVLRVPPGLSAEAARSLAGRSAARLGIELAEGARDAPQAAPLAELARKAAEAGVPVEWCCSGAPAEVAAQADAALGACASAGVAVAALSCASPRATHAVRALVTRLQERAAGDVPVVLRHRRDPEHGDDDAVLAAAVDLGAPLCDGLGDAVSLAGFDDGARAVDLAYRILQGARLRTTRTEYISCPSCGRTLFDLEETTARIKSKTEHLKGVKIAVMGCIVNGPGEMADADFGYVGSGPGVVSLYVGKEVVERRVPEDEAPDRLVDLIRKSGAWVDAE